MEIWFTNSSTEKLFNSEKKLRKKYGDRMAKLIMQRMTDLKACANFDIALALPGRLHPLVGSGDGWFAMDLVQPNRLVISPANDPLPYRNDEKTELDFAAIDEIEVVGVDDYH